MARLKADQTANTSGCQIILAVDYLAKASSRVCTCSGVSRQPEPPQFSATRSWLLLLGIAITLGRLVHQFSAT